MVAMAFFGYVFLQNTIPDADVRYGCCVKMSLDYPIKLDFLIVDQLFADLDFIIADLNKNQF
ncbi:hypothetical protein BLOT_014245 [Blomia tropicalis]|nr:hypothetical protein BLOT_014245 [Blomia tropicalis]